MNALAAYRALHGGVHNYGDISKIDWRQVPDFDLFTYSFPCQSISNAGRLPLSHLQEPIRHAHLFHANTTRRQRGEGRAVEAVLTTRLGEAHGSQPSHQYCAYFPAAKACLFVHVEALCIFTQLVILEPAPQTDAGRAMLDYSQSLVESYSARVVF